MYGLFFFSVQKHNICLSCITNNLSCKTGPSVILYHFKIFCQAYVSNMNFWLLDIFHKNLLQRFRELH